MSYQCSEIGTENQTKTSSIHP
uniref:Uncharacterized protein n=1 Tax=Anopheles dirus TaxID=7168 RepID=A0A182NY51_9DIPT